MTMQKTYYENKRFEEGVNYEFEIVNIQGEEKRGDYIIRPFYFKHEYRQKPIKQMFFPNQIAELVKALGYKEEEENGKKYIEWDDDEVIGQKILAMVSFRKYIDRSTGEEKKAMDLINFQGV